MRGIGQDNQHNRNRADRTWSSACIAMLLIAVLLLTAGCGYSTSRKEEAENRIFSVACIGDSLTYGVGVDDQISQSYPAVLGDILGPGYNVTGYGQDGAIVASGRKRSYDRTDCYKESVISHADILVVLLGLNDSKEYYWDGPVKFRAQYENLLDSYLLRDRHTRILLCTCPEGLYIDGQTEGAARFNIDPSNARAINKVIREVAMDRKLPLVDLADLAAKHPEWFSGDGIHPDAAGYAAMAGMVGVMITRTEID